MLANAIKKRLSKEEGQKGFTLIELLAVIVILGIIAVIAIPLVGNVIGKSKDSADVATARQVYDAARLYIIDSKEGNFKTAGDVKISELQTGGYLDKPLALPSTKKEISEGVIHFNDAGQLEDTAADKKDAVSFTVNSVLVPFSAKQVLSATK